VVAGHEPCGRVVVTGPGCTLAPGTRVVVYHIAGCGLCDACLRGYMVSCKESERAAHGWQVDGGHAPHLLTWQRCCVALPPGLSYTDGALAACGAGTAWEALSRAKVRGGERLLVVGLGPVGLSVAQLGSRLGCRVTGVDLEPGRCSRAEQLGLVTRAVCISSSTTGELETKFQVCVDCSGSEAGRLLAVRAAEDWARVCLVLHCTVV